MLQYVELRNDAGSQIIDDTYQNYRLYYMLPVTTQRCFTGLHVDIAPDGRRVCTFPYYDYVNGKSYTWERGDLYPNPWCSKGVQNKDSLYSPEFKCDYQGLYVTNWNVDSPIRHRLQPALVLDKRALRSTFLVGKEHKVPCLVALGSAMPNIVYNVSVDIFTEAPERIRAYIINLWQRAPSLTQQLYNMSFQGDNVGYTDFNGKNPKNNENFKAGSFREEAETAPVIYSFGLADSEITLEKGEMIVRNERNTVIFNNRYDYMRILDYFPSINALLLSGGQLYNSPKRFSYPGRKIAVVSLSQSVCYVCGTYPKRYTYCTGFWFPNPSTVEFTTCISEVGSHGEESVPLVNQDNVDLASLLNVMILDVTGCTPGWKYEAETGRPYLKEVE